MKQTIVLYTLTGVVLLATLALLYFLLTPPGHLTLSPSGGTLFVSMALVLTLAFFAPPLVRRWRGLPAATPMSPADIRFFIVLIALLCPASYWAVRAWGANGNFVILLAPLAYFLRSQFAVRSISTERNI